MKANKRKNPSRRKLKTMLSHWLQTFITSRYSGGERIIEDIISDVTVKSFLKIKGNYVAQRIINRHAKSEPFANALYLKSVGIIVRMEYGHVFPGDGDDVFKMDVIYTYYFMDGDAIKKAITFYYDENVGVWELHRG